MNELEKQNLELMKQLTELSKQYSEFIKNINELYTLAKPVITTQIQKFVEDQKTFEA